MSEENHRIWAE